MNKKITFLMTAMALILAIMGPRSVAWGQTTASEELCTSWSQTLAYATDYTHDYTIDNLNGSTTTMTLGVKGVYRQSNANTYFQMNKKTGYFKNTTKLPGKITKIETTWNVPKGPTKCYFATNAEASSSDKTVIVTATTSVTYTPPTDADYYFFNIDVSTGSGSAQMTSCIVYYEAKPAHTLTLSATNGSIAAMNGETVIESGDNVEEGAELDITATANDWYKFSGWNVSGTGSTLGSTTANPTTFTMGTADATLTATFAACVVTVSSNDENWGIALYDDESHTISTEAEDGYRISSTEPYTIAPADAATLTAGEDGEYIVSGVKDQDVEITINFEAIPTATNTVTFNAGANGTCSTTSLTEASAGVGITLPNCTPNEGYQFVGWATTNTATEADAGVAGATYYPTANITLYAVYNEVYTINYMVNGENTDPQVNVEAGTALVFPQVAAPDADHVFCGWVTTTIEGTQPTAPEYVNTEGLTATQDITYYAVFAEKSGTGETTYTKLSSNSFESSATYVLAAEESASSSTLHYFSSYTTTTANESWGVTSTTATDAITFTLSGTVSALVAQDASGNYLTPLATGKFRMSSTSQTLNLHDDGTIYNPTSGNTGYRLRYNHNNGSGGFRWYNGTTGTSAYFYKAEAEIIYSNYCTTIIAKELTSISLSGNYPTEFWKGDAFSHEGMTVTAHYSNAPDADVTASATFTGYDMSTAGGQTITVTYETQSTTYGITVKTIANTQTTAYTVAEAKTIIDANPAELATTEVYVQGIICQIDSYSSQYNSITYWISTDGTQDKMFEVYSGKNLNNANFTSISDIVLQADVIVYGKIKKFNSTYEFDMNNYLVSYTVPQSYTITLNQSTGGTISADKETAAAGETVTITIEPASGYTLATLTGATFNETVDPELLTYTFTMPAEEVTISATFNAVPTYTISFTTNGVAETATIVINQGAEIGSTLPEPTATNVPNGYTFRGWSAGDVALTDVEPTYITAETVPTGDMTLKAVFAMGETVEEEGQKTFVLTDNDFNGTSYAANNGSHTKEGITYTSNQVMKQSDDIQFQSGNGYIYNETAMKVTSISITKTAGTFTVYEGSEKHPTETITNNESGDYTFKNESDRYFSICVGNATGKVSNITVTYEGVTSSTVYSNYCTSVTALSGNLAEATTEAYTAYYISEAATVEGEVTINGVLGNADASLLVINNGGQLICNNEVAATVKKSISAINGNNGWYTIASPVKGSIDAPTAMTSSNEYDLYYYDEPEYTWRNYEIHGFQLDNEKGYLYANGTATDIEFAGTLRAGNDEVEVDLSYESTYQKLKGFNLVGNPFAHNIKIGTGYYVAENGSNLVAKNSATEIKPCQGFMVQADAEGQSITFNPSSKETQTEHEYITIAAGNGDFMDMAYICTNADEKLGKITLDNPTAKVYLRQGANDYAIAPLGEATSMVVCFKAPASGTYTINVSSDHEGVSLKDMKTGYVTAINHSASYTFEASENDAESRFKILFGTTVEENEAQMFVFQSGSNLIISGEGCVQIIDMMGRVLRSAQVESNATVSTEGMTAGTYVVRMLTANGVQTQKVIVK